MPRATSRISDEIADRRIRAAVALGRPPRGPSSSTLGGAAEVVYAPRSPAGIARKKKAEAAERRRAGIVLASVAARRAGCDGPRCGPGHGAHMDVLRDLLMAAGVIPDPLSRPVRKSKGAKSRAAGEGQ